MCLGVGDELADGPSRHVAATTSANGTLDTMADRRETFDRVVAMFRYSAGLAASVVEEPNSSV